MKIMDRICFAAAAAALAASLLVGCGASSAASSTASSAASSEAVSSVAASGEAVSEASDAKIKAQFTVTGADGESQTFDLEATDGEKLSDAGIISVDEAAAGFVTTVNGETADWDKDAAWWCLTDASGEMTAVGVADIQLHDGDSYAFTYTK